MRLLLGFLTLCSASRPTLYDVGARIPIKVGQILSAKNQVPYDYYSLPFCQPSRIHTLRNPFGQAFFADVTQNTPYEVDMKVDELCHFLCARDLKKSDLKLLLTRIDQEYFVNMFADGLPARLMLQDRSVLNNSTVLGYPIGVRLPGEGKDAHEYYLMNHVDFVIGYQTESDRAESAVVSFVVTPSSLAYDSGQDVVTCSKDLGGLSLSRLLNNHVGAADDAIIARILFSYSIRFENEPNIQWKDRWAAYTRDGEEDIHWLSIVNSFTMVLILSSLIAAILLRTLRRDIATYNSSDPSLFIEEETGWKFVANDVFRKPRFSKLLASFSGIGVQIILAISGVLCLSMLGFTSPQGGGSVAEAWIVLFVTMGGPGGFVSARMNKLFEGEDIQRSFTVTAWTATLYAGASFLMMLLMNAVLFFKGGSGVVGSGHMLMVLGLWIAISVPLVFIGAYMGYRKPTLTIPCKVNQIPRQIPKRPFYLRNIFSMALGGVVPFGSVFCEVSFLMVSVWSHKYYVLYGFLALVGIILCLTCAEVSILFTYLQLSAEDYRWWWKSFWTSAFSAVYLFGFSVFYFFNSSRLSPFAAEERTPEWRLFELAPVVLYFGYSAIAAFTFWAATGSIGFLASFFFVRYIYSAIKVD